MDAGKAVPVRREAVGQVRLGGIAYISAVAAAVFLGNLHIVPMNQKAVPIQLVPDLSRYPRSGGKQVVLEGEGVAGGGKFQLSQRPLRQEPQGQIRLIFQQNGITEPVHFRKIGALLILSVPLDHIFQVQEQVGNRGAFLEQIAVVGILRAVAQSLHEQGGFHIGGAGEGGNAVVVVQSPIVQGLGMGRLRPEAEVILLPLLHVADDRSRFVRALGIVGNTGARKVQAEADQIGDQLHAHHRQHQSTGAPALPVVFRPDAGCFLWHRFLGNRLDNIS